MELFISAWVLLIMDSYSAMSVTTPFSSHLVGEYCNSESHLSALMAPQTMTVISGPHWHKQLSQPFLYRDKSREDAEPLLFAPLFSHSPRPCILLLIRRQKGSDGWWQMNLQTAVTGDRAPLVELPHCSHATVNKLQKIFFLFFFQPPYSSKAVCTW